MGADPNPFRYCGEYFDVESGSYYLRARYYDPSVGRFTQEDTHWNASNMIYGDEPQQIGEYEDPLGTSRYVYAPQVTAIMQAGCLYGYGLNNPVSLIDPTGKVVTPANVIGAVIGAGGGALLGKLVADYYGLTGLKRDLTIAGFAVGGAALGWFAGPLVEKLAISVAAKLGLISSGETATVGTSFGKLGTLIENTGKRFVDWANITQHGLQRMVERGVTQQDVELWVKCGKALQQSGGKIAYITKEGVVILDAFGRVITVYGSEDFDEAIIQVIEQLYGK